jgi:hypothetical protein
MRKITSFLGLTLFLSFYCIGQPVFTSAYDVQIGQNMQVRIFEQNTLTPGPAGANQTWSFAGVPQGLMFSASIISPVGTPAASQFPQANKVFRFSNDTINFLRYYKDNSQQSEGLGSATYFNLPGFEPSFEKFTDTRIEARFPLNFGQSFTDTYSSSSTQEVAGQIVATTYMKGKMTMKYDAYGTLITPAGTFPNAIRMNIKETIKDSTVVNSLPDPIVNSSNKTIFLWFQNSGSTFPIKFQLEYDTIMGEDGLEPNVSGYYSQSLTSVESTQESIDWDFFPNPAGNFIEILHPSGKQMDRLRLVSSQGKVFSCPVSYGKVDLTFIPSGIYLLWPTGSQQPSTGRLIKN